MKTILDRLRSRASVSPDEVCYTYLDSLHVAADLTYRELDAAAQTIARKLLLHGAAGDRVLLLMPSGTAFLLAFWGCLYAGMIAVPLYPPKPNDRSGKVLNIIEDCGPRLAIVSDPLPPEQIAALHAQALCCLCFADMVADTDTDTVAGQTGAPPHAVALPEPEPDAIAFLQYSSGSTGNPKGVMISHRGMIANLIVLETTTRTCAADIFVGWLPLFHDMGMVMMVLMPVYAGARSVLFSPLKFAKSPLFWLQAISHYRGTISGAPNFAYDICARKFAPDALKDVDLSSWRMALNGAEPVRADTIADFQRTYSALGFHEATMTPAYGMAEATVFLCAGTLLEPPRVVQVSLDRLQQGRAFPPETASEKSQAMVSCGPSPAAHDMIVVQDAAVAEEDSVGEIWVKGESISSGYWGKPELSEQVFKAYTKDGAGPYLRTGDLGFVRDGELFVLGRSKDVLIVQGRNLYPHDLEACARALLAADAVGDAAVFGMEAEGTEHIVLLLEVRPRFLDRQYDDIAVDIRASTFESFGVLLSEIVFLASGAIMKTTSGKVMRSTMKQRHACGELTPLQVSKLDLAGAHAMPDQPAVRGTATEQALAAIWADLLKLDACQIGVQANFFALGGHSLLAVRLVAQVRHVLGVELGIKDLFANGSLAALAGAIDRSAGTLIRPQVTAQARGAALPLSFAQQRLWLLDRLNGGSAHYNMPSALRVTGRFDVAAAEQAFRRIIARHEPLRTVFAGEDEQLRQVIREQVEFAIRVSDLTQLDAGAREQAAQQLALADAQAPFDLARDVMLRASFILLGEEEGMLLFNMHHIASDGWSMDLLVKEFLSQYQALRSGLDNPYAPLAIGYADYAQWQRDWLAGPVLEEQLGYWDSQLAGLPPVHNLPLDRARPGHQSFRGARHRFAVGKAVHECLKQLAQDQQATLFMVLHAALSVLLARHGNSSDIVIGTPVANRLQKEL
ncbi:condensation domain-containing protein, partial [Janthinobacterium sp. SUN137]|uniref:condensation domain-containing protein n=1 Tax=Janthinobacterium sp. SUN137 TaxID=3014789 RepID=UPI002713D467